MKNLNSVAEDLFNKIRGRFPSVTIGDEQGTITTVPEQSRFYDFAFTTEGSEAGKVSISLDEENGITVIVGKDIVQNQPHSVKSKWFEFLRELRQFAKKRMLQFDVRDINKSNLQKRDYKHLAATRPGESTMAESKMYGTNKTSYQRIGGARLAIKHLAPINTESTTGRTQKIGSIFIESPEGERFRYPYRHLSGARAMARHVAEGGTAYDEFGQYISGLSEELTKLRKFSTYINRSGVMAETLGGYTDIVKERATVIRKEIQSLQKENYYREAREGFTAPIVEDVPNDVSDSWIDQLTIKQFNEELKDVFPYIYKLVGEASKAKEIGPDDLDESGRDGASKEKGRIKDQLLGKKKTKEEIELEETFELMMGKFSDHVCEECGNPSWYTLSEEKQKGLDGKVCWKGYKRMGTKMKGGKRVDNCVKVKEATGDSATAGYITVRLGKKMAGEKKDIPYLVAYAGHVTEPAELTYDKALTDASPISDGAQLRRFISRLLNSEKGEPHAVGKPPGVILALQQSESGSVGIMNTFPFISEIQDWINSRNEKNVKIELFKKDDSNRVDNRIITKRKKPKNAAGYDPQAVAPAEKKKTTYFSIKNPRLMNHLRQADANFMREYYRPNIKEFVMGEKEFNDFFKKVNSGEYKSNFGDPGIEIDIERSFVESANSYQENYPDDMNHSYLDGDDDLDAAYDEAVSDIQQLIQNYDEEILKDFADPSSYNREDIPDLLADAASSLISDEIQSRYDDSVYDAIYKDLYKYTLAQLTNKFKQVVSQKETVGTEKPKTPLGEFILSYFDRETGKFPKGETAVLTAVEKDYGDQYVEPARQFIEQVQTTTLEYIQRETTQSRYPETEMIKRLAGV